MPQAPSQAFSHIAARGTQAQSCFKLAFLPPLPTLYILFLAPNDVGDGHFMSIALIFVS